MKKIAFPIFAILVLMVGYKLFFSQPQVRNSNPIGENIIFNIELSLKASYYSYVSLYC